MIGYILLISFTIVISGIVYAWMKSYVPQTQLQCPDDVSIMLKNYTCNNSVLVLNLKNNGKFSIGGIFVNVRNDSSLTIATRDISNYTDSSTGTYLGSGILKFPGLTDNPLDPNQEKQMIFYLKSSNLGTIYSLDLNPIRWQEENNKMEMVNCGNSKITEQLIGCTVG